MGVHGGSLGPKLISIWLTWDCMEAYKDHNYSPFGYQWSAWELIGTQINLHLVNMGVHGSSLGPKLFTIWLKREYMGAHWDPN